VAGSPKQCIERLEEYHAAGCTQMMLELWGDDRLQQARLFGEKVLPHFHKK
jgi:alkanesulfonate monooxygenase SsuD/methylene tetrahydromethanopterin reductase-like flavin-dependent oxidoreductase (luciferase family)